MPPKATRQRRPPTQDRAKATREHILDTAAHLFGERGIAETSTNRIAAEAGVSIGTVYRYFPDRTFIVDELLERMLVSAEASFTEWMTRRPLQPIDDLVGAIPQLVTEIFEVFTEDLAENAKLVRAMIAGVQFFRSGIPELEPRLRLLVKLLLIQVLGPGDDEKYDTMTFVLINTGFAAVLRASLPSVDSQERRRAIAMTAGMIATFIQAEIQEPKVYGVESVSIPS
ncbi:MULTISPECIES: TetR/AcrR family transcriptional regulator [unclassified Nocardia]|uniref:TetR/AcrR family transcriptional regulator n=1 Tax=unclassified Nocardia TaxID=2637762 RepID=UPI0024A7AE95|nr:MULTISPECIES: TetR/AcrR family transcriptional regulator [unclassified Nocardia]